MDTIVAGLEDRFVTVDGLSLRYIEAGKGPVLILLHGASLGSSADVFARNLGPLADAGFRAIAFDQPGFGLSDNPTDHGLGTRRKSIHDELFVFAKSGSVIGDKVLVVKPLTDDHMANTQRQGAFRTRLGGNPFIGFGCGLGKTRLDLFHSPAVIPQSALCFEHINR